MVFRYLVDKSAELGMHRYIPTGFQSKELIVKAGLKLGDVDQFPNIDVTIDGADEVDDDLNCIKGGGACQLREKVLAEAAANFIIIADYRKDSKVLGTTWKQGVPIEVAPFAWAKVFQSTWRSVPSERNARSGCLTRFVQTCNEWDAASRCVHAS